jgi:hypothetical protein
MSGRRCLSPLLARRKAVSLQIVERRGGYSSTGGVSNAGDRHLTPKGFGASPLLGGTALAKKTCASGRGVVY